MEVETNHFRRSIRWEVKSIASFDRLTSNVEHHDSGITHLTRNGNEIVIQLRHMVLTTNVASCNVLLHHPH